MYATYCQWASQLAVRHLRLVTGRPACDVAHTVLPLHLAAVRHLHFEPCVARKRGKGYQTVFGSGGFLTK